jgi:hypothetical protein
MDSILANMTILKIMAGEDLSVSAWNVSNEQANGPDGFELVL